MVRLWKSESTKSSQEQRDQTVALLLFVVAVIAGLAIAVLLGDSIASSVG